MPTLTKDFLRQLRDDIEAALVSVSKKHETTLRVGHCSYDSLNGNFSFKLEGVAKGGVDQNGALYERIRRLRPKLPPLHTTFVYNQKTHRIVGSNKTLTKVLTQCGAKGFQFPLDAIEALCANSAPPKESPLGPKEG